MPKPTRRDWSPPNSTKAILSAGMSTRPPFWVVSPKIVGPSLARKRRHEVALDLFRVRVGVYHELSRYGLDLDLDFHGAPYASAGGCSGRSEVSGQPLIPRQASLATSCSAASLGIVPRVLSQYLALT